MTDEPDNIVLRYLRRLDEKTDRIDSKLDDLATDVRILKGHMAAFMQSETRQDYTIAELQQRLDRIERRLEISEG